MKTIKIVSWVLVFAMITTQFVIGGTQSDIAAAVVRIKSPVSEFCSAFRDIAGALASAIFIWAAIQWIMSRDQPGKRNQAKEMMIAVIVGMVIIGLSIEVVNSIAGSLGLDPTGDFCKLD